MGTNDTRQHLASGRMSGSALLALEAGLCLALLGGGAAAGWALHDCIVPKNWGVVDPEGLYRSALIHPSLVKRVLADNRINVIISLNGRDPDSPKQKAQEQAAARLGITTQWFPLHGDGLPGDGKIDTHVAALAALCQARQQGKRVLVQCAAGANRTGGVIAAYQLLVHRLSGQEVYREMVAHKWSPRKNAEMLKFLNDNMPAIAEALCRQGVLDRAALPNPIPAIQK